MCGRPFSPHPALSTALGRGLQSQHVTHSQEDPPTTGSRKHRAGDTSWRRGDLCVETAETVPELSPAALRAPPGYVCPDPRTLAVRDP